MCIFVSVGVLVNKRYIFVIMEFMESKEDR